ncbi:hypothetical protein ACIP39_05025 [Streptomyces tibetensis]|uniref:hypothetical protein n=1 Tax=Streptomyces tibetensis TaxID=2382123 RepID=UPI0038249B47
MDAAAQNEGQDPLPDPLSRAGAAFGGSVEIAEGAVQISVWDSSTTQPSDE